MRLRQAIAYHSGDLIDGLNAAGNWDLGVSRGTLEPFSRFISARDFGVVKRQFQSATEDLISGGYYTVRLPTGEVYLVQALNQDISGPESDIYNNVYLLQQALAHVEIISNRTQDAASGLPTMNVEHVDSVLHGYLSRLSSQSSEEFDQVRYTGSILTLPGNCTITTDNVVRVDHQYYEVEEVWTSVLNIMARVVRRSNRVR